MKNHNINEWKEWRADEQTVNEWMNMSLTTVSFSVEGVWAGAVKYKFLAEDLARK